MTLGLFSLRTKLTLALLGTSLAAASIVGIVAQWKLRQKFSAAVMSRSFDAFKSDVAVYFTTYGSWEQGEASEPFGAFVTRRHIPAGGPRGGGPPGGTLEPPVPTPGPISMPPLQPGSGPEVERPRPPRPQETPPFRFLLLDAQGRVLLPNPPYRKGDMAPALIRDAGMAITAGDRVVALAVPMDTPNLSERDDAYLRAMSQALWFGIGVASVMALVLGMVLGDTMSRTLRRLTAALQAVAAGDLQQRVETTSRDETGIVAKAFNRMTADLAEAVKLREEVDRIARHDLKTPLTAVIGVPRLLREDGRLCPEDAELLGIVERAGYRILNMVNLSLDLYKIEQGVYRVRPQLLDVHALLQTILGDIQPHAAAKRVAVRIALADGAATVYAWAEELLCYSLLANLLKNAVEASNEGATVEVTLAQQPEGVSIDIHNDRAVPATIRDRFFEKYATAGKAGGTGLGTYSARLMARVQAGDITMRSSDAEGTTLSVRLPGAPAPVETVVTPPAGLDPSQIADSTELPPLHVLLVDDDEYNRLILTRFLPSSVDVDIAMNGRDAIESAVTRAPDVILMDVEMPGMNGLEAARQIRERETALQRQPCVIIALSSHDDDATRQYSRDIGCDLYLTKPVTRAALLLALSESTRSRNTAAHQTIEVDPDLKDILPGFIESRREILNGIAQRLDAGDFEELRRLAHVLSGSLGMYGFQWASDLAHRIEIEAQSRNAARIADLLATLKRHFETMEIHCAG